MRVHTRGSDIVDRVCVCVFVHVSVTGPSHSHPVSSDHCAPVCIHDHLYGSVAHAWGGQLGGQFMHVLRLYKCPSVYAHMPEWPSVPSSV